MWLLITDWAQCLGRGDSTPTMLALDNLSGHFGERVEARMCQSGLSGPASA